MTKMATVTIRFPVPDTKSIDCGPDDEMGREWEEAGSSDAQIADAIAYGLESQAKLCWYQTVEVLSVSTEETGKPYDWGKEHVKRGR